MREYKVLALCPYEGMVELVDKINTKFPMFKIQTVVTDTRQEDYLNRLFAEEDYDFIMARGGLAKYAKMHSPKPCIEVEVTLFDLLTTTKVLESFPDAKSVVLGNMSLRECVEFINDLFGFSIETRIWEDKNEVEQLVDQAVEDGYNLVVGDAIVWRMAKSKGIPALLILSSEKSIELAFEKAVEFCRHFEHNQEKEAIWNYIAVSQGGYWSIKDHSGNVLYSNFQESDREILQTAEEKVKIMHGRVREGGFWQKGYYWEFRYSEETINDCGPFKVLRVYENLELNENLNAAFSIDKDTYVGDAVSIILNVGEDKRNLRTQIRDCADLDLSVLITGEEGTGRNSYAKEIHKISKWKDSIFIQINCAELTSSSVQKLFNLDNGLFSRLQKATLYFTEIQTMEEEDQKMIFRFLTYRKNNGKFRLLASSTMKKEELLSRKIVQRKLMDLLSEVVLEVPSLAEEKGNIVAITGLRLQEFNRRYGWRLSNIGEEGKKIMLDYDWPGNLNQLKDVLKLTVSNMEENTSTSVLRAKWIKEAIDKTDAIYRKVPSDVIDTEGTLEEIERRIIQKVLKECNMNQTKAAKRLGIGRSTMRRKL